MSQTTSLGADFARAFTGKDFARAAELLDPDVDFRALTPNRFWEAHGAGEVVDTVLTQWLEPTDEVEGLDAVDEDDIADRRRVGYRFTVTNPDGRHVVEQQAYYTTRDDRIDWIRIVCSGFRPLTDSA